MLSAQVSRWAGANGSSVCSNNHDSDRMGARNGEANDVDVAGRINPQFSPGPVGMQVQLCVNLQRGERCVVQNPPLTTPVSCVVSMPIVVRILTAGTDNKSCRIAVVRNKDVCEMSPFPSSISITCVCRAVPYQQARLTSTANGRQRIAVWHHGVWHTNDLRLPRTVLYCLTDSTPSATGGQRTQELSSTRAQHSATPRWALRNSS